MPREDYYQRQAEKIERYQELAEKKEKEGNALIKRAHQMADQIPFGQPILVGHYSEKRDRNYRDRIGNTWNKGFETLKTAEHYERKVQSIESNRAISSDAPDAIELLRQKLAPLEARQILMKSANKIIKSKRLTEEQKLKGLSELGIIECVARELLKPDFAGRIGYADYETTNNNANMRRIKERIAELEKAQTDKSTEYEIGDILIIDSVEDNRVMITFPGVPDESIRARLKGDGFRWSPISGAWQAYRSAAWKIPGIIKFLSVMPGYFNPSLLQGVEA